ncbi:hypothetical protein [Couchioplanes caeruleus]|uniref:Uncharacterized protein n=1 Tax=Couchioplanes caeruleus subsp. caeruleus TaxID=56427 RepID=A0A1K0GZT5_9ACTN|nr:hypothetical protein [Couchioplanes caeruleus]OJF14939.1 hypothetical protein BG844_07010 [Couchioplanes caeruleus subsp. caeruleus]
MTYDVIALVRQTPDPRAIVAGMVAAGEQLRVRETANGAVIQLCDDAGRPLVSLETPVLVQVPGEINRLLGDAYGDRIGVPVWWMEARAPSGRPEAEALARRFADEVARRLDGVVWPAIPQAAS